MDEEDEKAKIVGRARKLFYRRLRIGVSDGRMFIGKFHCLDKQGNIILQETIELRQGCAEHRNLGLVLIPMHCRVSCHVECSLSEQMSLLSI